MIFFLLQERPLKNLINVNLSYCEFITKLPKLWAPNLKWLVLAGCENLVKLTELEAPNLRYLNLTNCINLVKLTELEVPNLGYLCLSNCKNLVEIDECFGSLEKLTEWDLDGCSKHQILPSQLRLKSLYFFLSFRLLKAWEAP